MNGKRKTIWRKEVFIMSTSNWIELSLIILVLITGIPYIYKLKKKVKDIYGLKGIVKKADSTGDIVITYSKQEKPSE